MVYLGKILTGVACILLLAGCGAPSQSSATTPDQQFVKYPSDNNTKSQMEVESEISSAKQIGVWFAKDFFTLQGKTGPTDVGGLQLPAAANKDGNYEGMQMISLKPRNGVGHSPF